MKKTLIAIASVLAIVAGCAKNDIQPSAVVSGGNKVTASIETDTKATLDLAGNYMVWQADDSISVWDGVNNLQFILTSGEGTQVGNFMSEISLEPADTYYAVYPSQPLAVEDGELYISFPEAVVYNAATGKCENYVDGDYSVSSNVMVAKQAGTEIHFKNLCSYIILNIKGEESQAVQGIVIEGKDGQYVNGPAFVTFDESGIPSAVTFYSEEGGEQAGTAIVVGFEEPLALSEEGVKIPVAVAPVFANGFKATVLLADDTYQEVSTSFSIARNKAVEMPVFTYAAKEVAQIGDTKYTTIAAAVAAANEADDDVTIKMIANAAVSSTDTLNNVNSKKITLDLNDCIISGDLYEAPIFYAVTDLTIEDNGAKKAGCIENSSECLSGSRILMTASDEAKTLTVNGGTFKSHANQGVFYCRFGTVVINDGNFINIREAGGYAFYMYLAAANVTINGGSFIDLNGGTASAFRSGSSTVAIKGGYFHNGTSTGVIVDATGKTTATGGFFSMAPSTAVIDQAYAAKDISASPEVKTIDGSDYTFNYTVVERSDKSIIQIGTNKYETVAAAMTAANALESDATMTVLANINLEEVMEFSNANAAITLDLNGYTIYAPWPSSKSASTKDTVALVVNTAGVNLTICDNSESGKGTITQSKANNTSYAVAINAGTLNFVSGTISNTSSTGYGRIAMRVRGKSAACTVNITGGYLYGGRALILGSGNSGRKVTVNITGGKLEGLYGASTTSNYSVIGFGSSYGYLYITKDASIISNDAPLIYCGYKNCEIHITKSGDQVPHLYRNAFASDNQKFFSAGDNMKTFYKEIECYTNSTTVSHEEILTTSGATAHEVTEFYDGKTYTNYFYKDDD